jgi:hypothetical protein
MRPRQPKVEQQKQPLLAEQLWFDEERIEVRHSVLLLNAEDSNSVQLADFVSDAAVPDHHWLQEPSDFASASLLATTALASSRWCGSD